MVTLITPTLNEGKTIRLVIEPGTGALPGILFPNLNK